MKQLKESGFCWFCGKECEEKAYWHKECHDKWIEENR
jgi:hypothetical protein